MSVESWVTVSCASGESAFIRHSASPEVFVALSGKRRAVAVDTEG